MREHVDAKMRLVSAEILRQETAGPRKGSPEANALERAISFTRSAARRFRSKSRHDDATASSELDSAASALWGLERPAGWPSST